MFKCISQCLSVCLMKYHLLDVVSVIYLQIFWKCFVGHSNYLRWKWQALCDFHIWCDLLSWGPRAGVITSLSFVHNMYVLFDLDMSVYVWWTSSLTSLPITIATTFSSKFRNLRQTYFIEGNQIIKVSHSHLHSIYAGGVCFCHANSSFLLLHSCVDALQWKANDHIF